MALIEELSTFLQLLEALESDLKVICICELGRVVEDLHAQQRDDRHAGGEDAAYRLVNLKLYKALDECCCSMLCVAEREELLFVKSSELGRDFCGVASETR